MTRQGAEMVFQSDGHQFWWGTLTDYSAIDSLTGEGAYNVAYGYPRYTCCVYELESGQYRLMMEGVPYLHAARHVDYATVDKAIEAGKAWARERFYIENGE